MLGILRRIVGKGAPEERLNSGAKFCKRCALPVRWYGDRWMHTLPSGLAIRVGHEPEPGRLSEVQPAPRDDALGSVGS